MPTLKERFAAKKAQKQQQQTARLLKPATLGRHQINRANAQKSSISKMQQQYREQMRDVEWMGEYYTKEEAHAAYQSYLKEWNELVYCRNCFEHRGVFEKLHRNLTVALTLFLDGEPSFLTEWHARATEALRQEPYTRDQSPNQRRALLEPLMDLVIIGEALMRYMPKSSLYAIAQYGTGVQIRQAYLQFYEMPINAAKACIRIICGENWHAVARDYPEPKDKLRIMALNAAKCLYRIAECDDQSEGVPVPENIPALCHPKWREWADFGRIAAAAVYAKEQLTVPFENRTALSLTSDFGTRERAISRALASYI